MKRELTTVQRLFKSPDHDWRNAPANFILLGTLLSIVVLWQIATGQSASRQGSMSMSENPGLTVLFILLEGGFAAFLFWMARRRFNQNG